MFAARLVCSWIGALGLAAGAFCQTYVPFSLGQFTTPLPLGINEKGEVAGLFTVNFSFPQHGFVRDPGGTITTFDVPGSSATTAYSINNEGAITGFYVAPSGDRAGYIRDPEGNFTTFHVPGSPGTFPQSINLRGDSRLLPRFE
jgi:hypothetical protein